MLKIGSLYQVKLSSFRYNFSPTMSMWSYEATYVEEYKEYRYTPRQLDKRSILLYLGQESNCKMNDNNLIFLGGAQKYRINSSSIEDWEEVELDDA